MEMKKVESSFVTRVGHDPHTSTLHVEFKDGTRGVYHDVPPSKYAALLEAPSVGKFLHASVIKQHRFAVLDPTRPRKEAP